MSNDNKEQATLSDGTPLRKATREDLLRELETADRQLSELHEEREQAERAAIKVEAAVAAKRLAGYLRDMRAAQPRNLMFASKSRRKAWEKKFRAGWEAENGAL